MRLMKPLAVTMGTADNLITMILSAAVIQGFFLAFAVIRKKNEPAASRVLLASLLSSFSIGISHYPAFIGLVHGPVSSWKPVINEPFQLLISPLAYFYALSLLEPGFRFRPRHGFHLVPFAVYLTFLILLPDGLPPTLLSFLLLGASVVYLPFIHGIIRLYQRRLDDRLSCTRKYSLGWLRTVLTGVLLCYAARLFAALWVSHGGMAKYADMLPSIMPALFVYGIGYRSLFRPDPPDALTEDPRPGQTDSPGAGPKYRTSALSRTDSEREFLRLKTFTETEKPYLDPELSLPALSSRYGIPVHDLSRIINENSSGSFNDFINACRIREFKEKLALPENRKYTILSLAYDSGFNSKAAFNQAFRKHTGTTPTGYMKNMKPAARPASMPVRPPDAH